LISNNDILQLDTSGGNIISSDWGGPGTGNAFNIYADTTFFGNQSVEGTSSISGDATISGNLQVLGDASVNGIITTENGYIQSSSAASSLTITAQNGPLYLNSDDILQLDTSGGNIISSDWGGPGTGNAFNIYADTTFFGNQSVGGASLFVGDAIFFGNQSVGGDATIMGNLSIYSDPSSTSVPNIYGEYGLDIETHNSGVLNLVGDGGVTISSNPSSNVQIMAGYGANFVLQGTNSFITDYGNLSISALSTSITGDVTANNNLQVLGDSSVNGNLQVLGDATANNNLQVLGDSSVNGNLQVLGDSSVNGNLQVLGDSSVNGNFYTQSGYVKSPISTLALSGPVANFGASFVNIDATNVALVPNAFAGGNVTAYGDTSVVASGGWPGATPGNLYVGGKCKFNSDATVNGNLQVNGDSAITGDLQVNGDSTITENLQVNGDSTITGNLQVNGDSTVNGNFHVAGNFTAGSNGTYVGHLVHNSGPSKDTTFAYSVINGLATIAWPTVQLDASWGTTLFAFTDNGSATDMPAILKPVAPYNTNACITCAWMYARDTSTMIPNSQVVVVEVWDGVNQLIFWPANGAGGWSYYNPTILQPGQITYQTGNFGV
jgi:cytoskeletal protein CcmA (bactofilin family)